jgi:hypothetical protein
LLGLALWLASLGWGYAYMSRAQAEQSSQREELRQEMTALRSEVSACRVEGQALAAGVRKRLAAAPARGSSQLSPEDVDLIAARVLSFMKRDERPADERVLSNGRH